MSPGAPARPRIVVVGLGPGDPDLVTRQTLTAIASISHRWLRTRVHPSAHLVPDAADFDHHYEEGTDFAAVYAAIADDLVAAATTHGEVLYAVPGSPLVLERTVELLRGRPDVDCRVLPAVSFLDATWAALGIDPVDAGVRLVDGHRFAVEAAGERGPLLVAHVHADWVLEQIVLAVDPGPDDEAATALDRTEVTVLRALGTESETVSTVAWSDLRDIEVDHLTSLWIPTLAVPVAAGYARFHELARTLRERCPWDIEQTHRSLVPYLVEEAYEVVDAIDHLDPDDERTDEHLIEELGDLLYQIEFHATIAEQEGRFTIADVTAAVHDKLVRRHPHVFGEPGSRPEGLDAAGVVRNWERIKAAERSADARPASVLDGVPGSLPALAHANTLQRKAAKVGFDWPDVGGALDKVTEEAAEIVAAGGDAEAVRSEVGDLLFAVVNVARHLGVEPETALRSASGRFRERFTIVERLAGERALDLSRLPLEGLDALWDEAKAIIADRERP
jgi:tetrapyrrole methylase family protein/MazG family protein